MPWLFLAGMIIATKRSSDSVKIAEPDKSQKPYICTIKLALINVYNTWYWVDQNSKTPLSEILCFKL